MIIPLHLLHECMYANMQMQPLSVFLVSLLISIFVFKRCLSFPYLVFLFSFVSCFLASCFLDFWLLKDGLFHSIFVCVSSVFR